MIKNIHFFGCSLTAGDELSDHEYFPWKSECKNFEEFYQRREDIIDFDYFKYQEDNKAKAYPSILGGINHAENGASLKANILKIIQLINSGTPIDAIYLQLPSHQREMYITDHGEIKSVRFNQYASTNNPLGKYIDTKILTHSDINFLANDIIDLISFDSFIRSNNINFGIISFGPELLMRHSVLRTFKNDSFKFLLTELNKLEMINIQTTGKSRHLGGHFKVEVHEYIASVIKQHLSDKFSILV
jgi:hypothetical protein